ncbi:carbohydrate ABC transporter permease [Amnibacterium kyonggiense]|uniref:Multiple sugar transport system permease protein n=1 Tax=Amnibacterium kyonggiense TaxID=595671 RepID=A0A4R7FL96_9MICO|nr:sugar ABC transporter permease [Amnibacterium kyonggiense]TDS77139.1 multiple sugar transport system permease protein [Amnibacterium kyonggiense]
MSGFQRAVPRAAGRPATRRGGSGVHTDGWWPVLFVAPLLIGVAAFYLWPIVQTFWFSFTTFGVFGGQTFSGVANYVALVQDPEFYTSLGNTLIYTAIVLLGVPLAVWLAALLNTPGLRFASFYRVLFFLPYIAMPTAVALVWRLIFNGDYGVLNWFLSLVGLPGPYWVSTPGFAILAVSIVGLWSSLGFSMIVLAAGLKAIPPELYEAAELDGASPARRFRSVTVPLLTPTIFFVTVVTVISSFQLFDLLYAIMGPRNPAMPSSMSLVFYFFQAGFVDNQQGFAAAIAMAIFALIGLVTLVQFRLQRRWVADV